MFKCGGSEMSPANINTLQHETFLLYKDILHVIKSLRDFSYIQYQQSLVNFAGFAIN